MSERNYKQDIAVKVARAMFKHRGNYSEMHVREMELTAILYKAINLYECFVLMCDDSTPERAHAADHTRKEPTDMSEHTPTPWGIEPEEPCMIFGEFDTDAPKVICDMAARPNSQANAEFVRALNAHALVEALTEALEYCCEMPADTESKIKAALHLARGERAHAADQLIAADNRKRGVE